MTQRGHDWFEVLISSSLSGDISPSERVELDAHLDSCDRCTATLAAFAEQRRVMSGLRHLAPPSDLNARVRTGIESGAHAGVPWWRRPTTLFGGLGVGLATVAGALLALTILNAGPSDQNVGFGSGSPDPSAPSATLAASFTPEPSTTPSQTAAASPSATPEPTETPAPAPTQGPPEPEVYLALTGPFDNLLLTIRDGATGETLREVPAPASGPPLAAQLSPDGEWLAYITRLGESGLNELWALRVGEGANESPIGLGQSVAGSEFLEQLSWSSDGRYLAFTISDPSGAGTDAWVFDADGGGVQRLTATENAYAGSWFPGVTDTPMLWVSTAGERPISYLMDAIPALDAAPLDNPSAAAGITAEGVFQPLVSPDASGVIFWQGVMQQSGNEWLFAEGGAPYIGGMVGIDGSFALTDAEPLFSDVVIDRDAFSSAGIAWGADGDAYAVWGAQWTGLPQGETTEYPDESRVYFSHAADERNIREVHAIDEADLPAGTTVIDVKVTTTRHLVITAQYPSAGTLSVPRADLIFVARNTGDVADEVTLLSGESGWFGPAAHVPSVVPADR